MNREKDLPEEQRGGDAGRSHSGQGAIGPERRRSRRSRDGAKGEEFEEVAEKQRGEGVEVEEQKGGGFWRSRQQVMLKMGRVKECRGGGAGGASSDSAV